MSASTLEREEACPASAALPQVVDAGDEEATARGSAIHAFTRSVIAGVPRDVALAAVLDDDWRATCAGISFDELVGDLRDVRAEVAYAVDTMARSARFVGVNVGRAYGFLATYEIAGTNDHEGVGVADDLVTVDDIKTGMPVTPCRENAQLGFHALARAQTTGASRVRARIRYIGPAGRIRTDEHTFGAFDLDDVADRLHAIRVRVLEAKAQIRAGEVPTVYTGDHCRWCPALQACPAHVSLVKVAASATHIGAVPIDRAMSIAEIMPYVTTLTAADKAIVWDLAARGERVFKTIREALRLIARQEPFDLANGQRVSLGKEFERENFSQSDAIALLRAKGATEDEIDELWKSTTTAQVRARGKAVKRLLKVVA